MKYVAAVLFFGGYWISCCHF